MATNLPAQSLTDSATATKLYFDTYGKNPLEFSATEVTACVSFFKKRGFDEDAALVTATTILKQAKLEGVNVFSILDGLKGFADLEISALVSEILNNNRIPTSTLGYKKDTSDINKIRTIYP